jgi:spore germination cell wall hydrolase CwlJ-like protein
MFGYVRAAAFAVAAVGAALAPSFADPSMAWELESAPTAAYIDHAAATLDDGAAEADAVDTAKTFSQDIDFSATVAEHAAATLALGKLELEAVRPLSALVDEHAAGDTPDTEMECLAGAIYFESKGEPLSGQLAVAEVIINRAKSGRYPTSLCGVVKQPSQFSFVRGGRIPAVPRDNAHWRKAVAIAHIAVNDLADSPAPQALAFHATRVSPGWRMKRVARVGNHIFYR